jgi:hypothetical protein
VFVISAICEAVRAVEERERRLAAARAPVPRRFAGHRARYRPEGDLSTAGDPAILSAVFFPFDMRGLVDGGRTEEGDDRD